LGTIALCACSEERKKRIEKKEQENSQPTTHQTNNRAVFFLSLSLSYSEIYIE